MKNNDLAKNLLICGDNLTALDDLIKKGIKVDLIYLDPPFFSNRHYEVIWGDEAEVRSFKDRWEGGINVYIEWMKERIVKMYDVLKDTGSFYLHCDWHAGHYLKIMLDDVFGYHNFRNEIIWDYTFRMMDLPNFFNRKHDTIFFYAKTVNSHFKMPKVQWTREEIIANRKQKVHLDENGNECIWMPGGKGHSKNKLKKIKDIIKEGKAISDVWQIPIISSSAKERLGYPTQKPEALLERIIKASSKEGDLILDPFCGCGTAMAVAHHLNRKWIGIDISPTAINLIEKRLEKLGAIKNKDFETVGMPTTLSELKNLEPFEFQNWAINEMGAKQSKKLTADFGLDGHIEKSLYSEEAGIQVKQSDKVGRNAIDNFETALQRKGYKRGYIIGFSFTKGAHEEAARVREERGLYIKLIETEDLLKRKAELLK